MRACIESVSLASATLLCLFLCLSSTPLQSQPQQAPELLSPAGPQLVHRALMDQHTPVIVKVVQSGGTHSFLRPGRESFDIFGGASVEVNNPESRDGNSFGSTRTLHEENFGCWPGCSACSFSFVVAIDIEPTESYEGSDEDFNKDWHGEDGTAKITWSVSGAGSESGWGGINDEPNTESEIETTWSDIRFTVSESLACNTSKKLIFTANTAVEGTANITVDVIITCGACNEW